jgi:protein involved in polysaccharide export with SLBB domain
MRIRRIALVAVCMWASMLPAQETGGRSSARVDGRAASESQATEEDLEAGGDKAVGSGVLLIGMEAYREVLRSGQYLVGPGDRFLIQVSGLDAPVEATVLAEGGLFIPGAGRAQVGGLSLRQARAVVDDVYQRYVQVGSVAIELSAPRRFPVSVVGLVEHPGIVDGSGVERVSELIRKAGGLSDGASRRNIYIVRASELTPNEIMQLRRGLQDDSILERLKGRARRVDLALYEVTGTSDLNPFLVDGDIVIVPSRRYILRAIEAVRRGGTYEYVHGDRLSDLIALAMGPSSHYDANNVYLFRYTHSGTQHERIRVDMDAAIAGDAAADISLEPGDWLVVKSRANFQQQSTVRLIGEVEYAGFYVIDDGVTSLRDVIDLAGGITELASLPKARIVRELDDEEQLDPEFERILTIPPAAWSEEEKQYFNMRSREKRGQMVVDFVALFADPMDPEQNIFVRPGDVIVIPSSLRTVLVSGRAAFPGAVPFEPGFSVDDYIARAGGFGWRASRDVRVIKARTGEILEADDVDQVEPGDNIWIKEKPVRDYWLGLRQVMSVAGEVATVILLFRF